MMMVAIDPRGLKILWTTPVVDTEGVGGHPAIGSDGTVYIYDPEQNLVGLDPHTGAVVWQPKCEKCVPQSHVPFLCNAKALYGYLPPHPDILISPDDYLYACYKGFFVVFGPAPDRPVISKASSTYEGLWGTPPVIGPDGTFYFLSEKHKKDEYKLTVEAVMLGGIKKWSKLIYQSVRQSVQNLYLVAGENAVYVFLANIEGNSQVLALDRECGDILWTREFPELCGVGVVLCPRPVLSPQGLLYVLLFQEDGEWLVALDTKNEGEQSWSVRVGEAVDYGYRPDYFSLLLTTDNALLVGTNKGVLQIESQTGELSSCVIPGFGRIAMSPDGTVYIVGDSLCSRVGGAWDILVKSVPNKPPSIVSLLSSNPRSPWGGSPELIRVEFEATIEDTLDWTCLREITAYWDFGDGQTKSNSFGTSLDHGQYIGHLYNNVTYDLSNLAKMTFPVQLTVISGGVEGCSVSTTAETIVCLEPPTIQSAEATPGRIYVGTRDVEFNCDATPPEAQAGQVLEYTWDFGDGGIESGENKSVTHRYTKTGVYHPTVKVNVKGMPFKASQTMAVEVAIFPTLSISTTQKPNRCIEFNCDVEDPFDQNPSYFSWKFGDGSNDFIGGKNPSYVYDSLGIYEAMVTVKLPDPEVSLIKEFQVYVQDLDSDSDLILDADEALYGTDPNNPDTDGDGVGDAEDLSPLLDPAEPVLHDFHPAGMVRIKQRIQAIGLDGWVEKYHKVYSPFFPNYYVHDNTYENEGTKKSTMNYLTYIKVLNKIFTADKFVAYKILDKTPADFAVGDTELGHDHHPEHSLTYCAGLTHPNEYRFYYDWITDYALVYLKNSEAIKYPSEDNYFRFALEPIKLAVGYEQTISIQFKSDSIHQDLNYQDDNHYKAPVIIYSLYSSDDYNDDSNEPFYEGVALSMIEAEGRFQADIKIPQDKAIQSQVYLKLTPSWYVKNGGSENYEPMNPDWNISGLSRSIKYFENTQGSSRILTQDISNWLDLNNAPPLASYFTGKSSQAGYQSNLKELKTILFDPVKTTDKYLIIESDYNIQTYVEKSGSVASSFISLSENLVKAYQGVEEIGDLPNTHWARSPKYNAAIASLGVAQGVMSLVGDGTSAWTAYKDGNMVDVIYYSAQTGIDVANTAASLAQISERTIGYAGKAGKFGKLTTSKAAVGLAVATGIVEVSYNTYQLASTDDPILKLAYQEKIAATTINTGISVAAVFSPHTLVFQLTWTAEAEIYSLIFGEDFAYRIAQSPGSAVVFLTTYFITGGIDSTMAETAYLDAREELIAHLTKFNDMPLGFMTIFIDPDI